MYSAGLWQPCLGVLRFHFSSFPTCPVKFIRHGDSQLDNFQSQSVFRMRQNCPHSARKFAVDSILLPLPVPNEFHQWIKIHWASKKFKFLSNFAAFENDSRKTMPKIFISYKRLDKDKVFPIVDQIRKETGIDCWIDLEGIESGDQFQNVIIDAIDNADIFVFMLSHNFIAPYRDERTGKIDLRKQTFPEKEVMYALRHGKRMVPASIDGTMVYDCKWLDFNCSGLDSIDWNDESQRSKLMRDLRQWAVKPAVPGSSLNGTPVLESVQSRASAPTLDDTSASSASTFSESPFRSVSSKPVSAKPAQTKPASSRDVPSKSTLRKSGIAEKLRGNFGKIGIVCTAVLLSGLLVCGLVALFGPSIVETLLPSFPSIVKDLSSPASANCYIVSQSGTYKFRTVKGNSSESVGQVASAEVLWESFGTSAATSKGDLIESVAFADGFVTFSTAETFREGNALIAVKDADGTILWSWHIWLTDAPQGQTYNNNAGVMMDRNLGATSSTPGDVGVLGLLYQWGRKDPFLGSSLTIDNIKAKSTIIWPSTETSSSTTGTIAYSIAHPIIFITYNDINKDWYYTGGSSTDDTRWQSSKTIYDPCPAGWRVPDGGSSGVWSKAFGTSSYWELSSNWYSTSKGMDFYRTDKKLGPSGPIWYPASGYRDSSDGALNYVGDYGTYWSVSLYDKYAYGLYFNGDGIVNPVVYYYRAGGKAVRCLQE